jgi:hypothetical protein
MAKYGIDNLKKVVDLGCEVEQVVMKVIQNGNNTVANISLLAGALPQLMIDVPAVINGWAQVIPEFKDLDNEESAELVTYVVTKLAVTDVKAQVIIEKAMKLALDMYVDGTELFKAIHAV